MFRLFRFRMESMMTERRLKILAIILVQARLSSLSLRSLGHGRWFARARESAAIIC